MKRVVIALVFCIGMSTFPVRACVDQWSGYSVGVVFSDGEQIVPGNIEQYSIDPQSYIKRCEKIVPGGQLLLQPVIITGVVESLPTDPLSIEAVEVVRNVLRVDVSYGGGCGEHVIELATNGEATTSIPGRIDLHLSHNAQGDSCMAIVKKTLYFDLTTLPQEQLIVNVFAPGAEKPFSPSPLWSFVSDSTAGCSYTIRSVFSEKVMVYIGPYTGFNAGLTNKYQLLLVFDTASVLPSTAEKAAALQAELERLVVMEVLSMGGTTIAGITAALADAQGQYWTEEDTVLPFNMWFDDGNISGVRGVYSVKGCGISVDYLLPEKTIQTTGAVFSHHDVHRNLNGSMKVRKMEDGISVSFMPVSGNASFLKVMDLRGRVVRSLPLAANTSHIRLPRFNAPAGCYMVAIVDKGKTVQSVRAAAIKK